MGLVLGAVGLLQVEQFAGQLLAGGAGHGGRMVLAVTLHLSLIHISVYLGANAGNDPALAEAVRELGSWIGANGHRLVSVSYTHLDVYKRQRGSSSKVSSHKKSILVRPLRWALRCAMAMASALKMCIRDSSCPSAP